jgi:large subunit ribosomal protein L33
MSQDNLVKMECKDCKRITHFTKKNKKTLSKNRLELSKFCKHCRKHTSHKETK